MKTYTAVLHLKRKEPLKVYELGGRVCTCILANGATFPEPDPPIADVSALVTTLDRAIKFKDGSKQRNQTIIDQTNLLYEQLKLEINYVNKVAHGDKAIIILSGFDCNDEPAQHGIPGKALIKRVEDGNIACSAKIFVEALEDADRYKVELNSTLADPTGWKTVLDYGALNRIEIRDLIRGQEIFIRVSGGNTRGWGINSEPAAFIPR